MPYVLPGPSVGADLLFPDTLPVPTLSGYSNTYAEPGERSERESGHDRYRLNFQSVPRIETVQWDFSQEEFAIFEEWYRLYCKNGTLRFDIQLSDYDSGLAWSEASFLEDYDAENLQPSFRWRVSARLLLFGLPFAVRYGPVELNGRAYRRSRATGALSTPEVLYGDASLSLSATGQLAIAEEIHGRASMVNEARLIDPDDLLHGRASLTWDAKLYDELDFWTVDGVDNVTHDGVSQVAV